MHPSNITTPRVSSSQRNKLSLVMASESDPDEVEEPFSPSIFLNLPPTPTSTPTTPHDEDGQQDPAALSSDDLVMLPFISCILMADDDDDKLLSSYHYHQQCPDHQALLLQEAQQPFAEILSDTTNSTNDFTVVSSPPFFPNNTHGRLTTGDHADTTFLTEQDNYTASVGRRQFRRQNAADKKQANMDKTTTLLGVGGAGGADDVGEHDEYSVFFGKRIKVTMDMLNQAFLMGLQEANKFLPTTTSILPVHSSEIILAAGSSSSREHLSLSRDIRRRILAADEQAKKGTLEDGIFSSIMFQESGSSDSIAPNTQYHNWDDDLELEIGRKMADLSIAVIAAPESSDIETGEKKRMDKFIVIKYQSLLNKTMGMTSIRVEVDSMEGDKKKNAKKGKRKSAVIMGNDEPVVDLSALLMRCAHAVATGDRPGATELLYKIRQHSSPSGDATQRLAHCFAPALEARLDGKGSQVYKSLMVKQLSSANESLFLKAYQLCIPVSCFKMMAFMFSNLTILKAISAAAGRRRKLHIVDYGEHYGFQWPTLLGNLAANWEVRITCIILPKPGVRPAARTEETRRRLDDFARRCGIPFKFRCIVAKWETVCADDLNIEPDEVLIVNGLADFGRLMDEDSPISPRDMVLKNIQKMRPDVFILFIENSSYNTPFFLARFREALFYHSAVFDMMDAVAPRDNKDRVLFEQNLLGRHAFNVIACEGCDRVERPETYKQWQVRNNRAGLRQLPLDPDIVKAVSKKVRDNYPREFVVNVDEQWLLQGWKGRILYAMSTWVAKDGGITSLG